MSWWSFPPGLMWTSTSPTIAGTHKAFPNSLPSASKSEGIVGRTSLSRSNDRPHGMGTTWSFGRLLAAWF